MVLLRVPIHANKIYSHCYKKTTQFMAEHIVYSILVTIGHWRKYLFIITLCEVLIITGNFALEKPVAKNSVSVTANRIIVCVRVSVQSPSHLRPSSLPCWDARSPLSNLVVPEKEYSEALKRSSIDESLHRESLINLAFLRMVILKM